MAARRRTATSTVTPVALSELGAVIGQDGVDFVEPTPQRGAILTGTSAFNRAAACRHRHSPEAPGIPERTGEDGALQSSDVQGEIDVPPFAGLVRPSGCRPGFDRGTDRSALPSQSWQAAPFDRLEPIQPRDSMAGLLQQLLATRGDARIWIAWLTHRGRPRRYRSPYSAPSGLPAWRPISVG